MCSFGPAWMTIFCILLCTSAMTMYEPTSAQIDASAAARLLRKEDQQPQDPVMTSLAESRIITRHRKSRNVSATAKILDHDFEDIVAGLDPKELNDAETCTASPSSHWSCTSETLLMPRNKTFSTKAPWYPIGVEAQNGAVLACMPNSRSSPDQTISQTVSGLCDKTKFTVAFYVKGWISEKTSNGGREIQPCVTKTSTGQDLDKRCCVAVDVDGHEIYRTPEVGLSTMTDAQGKWLTGDWEAEEAEFESAEKKCSRQITFRNCAVPANYHNSDHDAVICVDDAYLDQ